VSATGTLRTPTASPPPTYIFAFLYECFEAQPQAAFVGFFLGYDFAQWLKGIPERKARLLLTEEGQRERTMRNACRRPGAPAITQPVRVCEELGPDGGWELRWLPGKRLELRPLTCRCETRPRPPDGRKPRPGYCRCGTRRRKPYMAICDAGPLFQSSLLSVIDPDQWETPVCTPEEFELITRGKASRADAPLDDEMRAYNRLENRILARLLSIYDEALRTPGIDIFLGRKNYYGPGPVAAKWLGRNRAPHRTIIEGRPATLDPSGKVIECSIAGVVPVPVLEALAAAYLSGWFELCAHGTIPGTVWQYDIVSAYPHQIARLPCLLHGTWRHLRRRTLPAIDDATQLCLVHCPPGGVVGSDDHLGAMQHRRPDASICRPQVTGGWFWLHELEASRRAGLTHTVNCDEMWVYDRCGCPPPLGVLADLFDMRIRAGTKTPLGRAIKLMMNSVYGKFCQSVGTGPFRNYLYASLITAGTRGQILDAIATHPLRSRAVVMIATDAVYFTAPHPTLNLCKTEAFPEPILGWWEEQVHQNVTLFKPGVYWDDHARDEIRAGRRPVFRARGIDYRAFAKHIDEIDALFAELVDNWIDDNPMDGFLAGDSAELYEARLESLDAGRGALRKPPRLQKVPERHGGGYRSPGAADYDWFFGLAKAEQARLRNGWMSDAPTAQTPDEIFERIGQREWLDLTRRIDMSRALAAGREPSRNRYGGLRPDSLEVEREPVVDWPAMTYRSDFGMVSPKQALARNRWDLAGHIEQPLSVQSSDPTRKRTAPYLDAEQGVIRTGPYHHVENLESAPYVRPAMRAGLARVLDDGELAPWDYESPDGPVGAIVAGMLGTGQWS
jgi:hypothetical protein